MNFPWVVAQFAFALLIAVSGCGGGGGSSPVGGGSPSAVAPTIASQPQDVRSTSGQMVTFAVTATGDPTLAYQWSRDGQVISGATSSSYAIANVALGDEGSQFRAVVSNAAGTATSASATLHVNAVPGVNLLAGGLGGRGYADGVGAAARFGNYVFAGSAIAVDASGTTFIADGSNHTIRKVSSGGAVSTFAGAAGQDGHLDGVGSAARFSGPTGLALDGGGNLYVAERANTIRKISPAGVVTTLAGSSGVYGASDGTGAAATFGFLSAIASDLAGTLYVLDDQSIVRKVSALGVVTTIAGSPGQTGIADGTGAAARFGQFLSSVAVDADGNAYVLDSVHATIRKVTPAGVVSTFVGAPDQFGNSDGAGASARINGSGGISFNAAGDLIVVQNTPTPDVAVVRKIDKLGVITTTAASVRGLGGVSATGAEKTGGVIVLGHVGVTLHRVSMGGTTTDLAGTASQPGFVNGSGSAARFDTPFAAAADALGNAYVGDTANYAIRKVTPAGAVSTLAGGASGALDGTGIGAQFGFISAMASDQQGNLFVVDGPASAKRIRKATPSGVVTTFADASRFVDPTGLTLYLQGITVDPSGNVLVCDLNRAVRSISPQGVVSVVSPSGCLSVVADKLGNVYLFKVDSTINKMNSDGSLTLLAGKSGEVGSQDGAGPNARFGSANGTNVTNAMATDSAGNIYLADGGNAVIRKITPSGNVTTVAGVARLAQVIPGAPGGFNQPTGVAVAPTPSGVKLLVTDVFEHALLQVVIP